jgi:hypothetical protein
MYVDRIPIGTAIVSIVSLLATSANAAMVYKAERTTEGGRGGTKSTEVIENTIDGAKAKIVFLETQNPMFAGGGYMLVTGPATAYMVSPARQAYLRIDKSEMQAIGGAASQAQQAATASSGMGDEIKDFEMKQLVDEPGPTMLGMPTRHYKFELKYTQVKSSAMNPTKMVNKADRTYEIWATDTVEVPKESQVGLVLGGSPSAAPQVAEAEQRIASVGFPLKKIADIKESSNMAGGMGTIGMIASMGRMGGTNDTVTTELVTDLRQTAVPADTFDLPKGYAEMTMMGPSSAMPNLNQMPAGMPAGMQLLPGVQMPPGMPPGMGMPQGPGTQAPQGMPDLNQIPPTDDTNAQ